MNFLYAGAVRRSQRENSDHNGKEHADRGEAPHIEEAGPDVILDIDLCKTYAEQSSRNHGADEGCAVAADDHGDGDRKCRDAKALPDADHDREHTVEVAVRVEGQRERYREDTDDQRQVHTECRGQHHGDEICHAGDDACNLDFIYCDIFYQNTHEHGCAHQSGAHHESRAGVGVDDLLLHFDLAVVHEDGDADTQHEGEVAREDVPDQEGDDGNCEADVEGKELRAGELVDSLCAALALYFSCLRFLCQSAVQAGAALLLLYSGEYGMRQHQHDAKKLNREQHIPETACFHAEHGGCAHGRAGPGHEIQNAHREDGDAKQGGGAHMHLLIHRKHGRDYDQKSRSAAAVQMADEGDDRSHHGHADHTVSDEFHQFTDDHIEHPGVCHNAEEQHAEDEERCGGARALEAGLNQGGYVIKAVVAAQHQNQRQNRWEEDEGDAGKGLTLE